MTSKHCLCLPLLLLLVGTVAAAAEPAELAVADDLLYGTIETPAEGEAPWPLVLIQAGSGPTDRDGNSAGLPGKNNGLKYLAEELASRGIASLRVDKRGIGASVEAGPTENDLRFDVYVDDLAAWGKWIAKDERFSKVIVLGHSEGSLVGMLAARKIDAAGFVSVAGAGRRIDAIILDQITPQLPPEMLEQAKAALVDLVAGRQTDKAPPALGSLFRLSVQPYMISWLKYDPTVEIEKLKAPVLVLQGTTDVQMTEAEAHLLADAARDAKLVLIEGMNHVLKMVSGTVIEQYPSYSDPDLPVSGELIEAVAGFVDGIE